MKLHIVIDTETLAIMHFTITGWRGSDTTEFQQLARYLPQLGNTFGDKTYSSRKNCQLVDIKNGTPYLCFKTNATGKTK